MITDENNRFPIGTPGFRRFANPLPDGVIGIFEGTKNI